MLESKPESTFGRIFPLISVTFVAIRVCILSSWLSIARKILKSIHCTASSSGSTAKTILFHRGLQRGTWKPHSNSNKRKIRPDPDLCVQVLLAEPLYMEFKWCSQCALHTEHNFVFRLFSLVPAKSKGSIKTYIFFVISSGECISHTETQTHEKSNLGARQKQFITSERCMNVPFWTVYEIQVNSPWTCATFSRRNILQVGLHYFSCLRISSSASQQTHAVPLRFDHFETVAFDTSIRLRVFAKLKRHRLRIAFTYIKQRTLHVPVVWPSAPSHTRHNRTDRSSKTNSDTLHRMCGFSYYYIFSPGTLL